MGFKERAYGGEPGLTLRFTRLDARSKTILDRAAALRESSREGIHVADARGHGPQAVRFGPRSVSLLPRSAAPDATAAPDAVASPAAAPPVGPVPGSAPPSVELHRDRNRIHPGGLDFSRSPFSRSPVGPPRRTPGGRPPAASGPSPAAPSGRRRRRGAPPCPTGAKPLGLPPKRRRASRPAPLRSPPMPPSRIVEQAPPPIAPTPARISSPPFAVATPAIATGPIAPAVAAPPSPPVVVEPFRPPHVREGAAAERTVAPPVDRGGAFSFDSATAPDPSLMPGVSGKSSRSTPARRRDRDRVGPVRVALEQGFVPFPGARPPAPPSPRRVARRGPPLRVPLFVHIRPHARSGAGPERCASDPFSCAAGETCWPVSATPVLSCIPARVPAAGNFSRVATIAWATRRAARGSRATRVAPAPRRDVHLVLRHVPPLPDRIHLHAHGRWRGRRADDRPLPGGVVRLVVWDPGVAPAHAPARNSLLGCNP